MVNVAFGCCVGSWERFNRYVVPFAAGRQITALSGRDAIALAYNAILEQWKRETVDIGILQHDDLEITQQDAIERFITAFESDGWISLLGVAGGSADTGLGWWNASPVGHQRTDAQMIDFGPREGYVDLLEGSLLVFNRRAITDLRFVERLGFHGYDEIAYHANAQGWKTKVVDVDTHHHTALGFDNEQSHADWLAADRWFRETWKIGVTA